MSIEYNLNDLSLDEVIKIHREWLMAKKEKNSYKLGGLISKYPFLIKRKEYLQILSIV